MNTPKKHPYHPWLTFVCCLIPLSVIHAEPSQVPLEIATAYVEPNVMIMLDSSGSMNDNGKGTIAKQVISDILNDSDNDGIRFCGSYFNKSTYDHGYRDGAQIDPGMGCSSDAGDKQALITAFNAIVYTGGTPLAETAYDITRYFRHQQPYFGSFPANIADPIISECQSNSVIYISDGRPSVDWDRKSETDLNIDLSFEQEIIGGVTKNLPNWDNINNDDTNKYLDDLALFAYEKDMSALPGLQNLTTHTIGFQINLPMLQDAANYGHGIYKTADTAAELSEALKDALNNTPVEGTGTGGASSGPTLANGAEVDFFVTEYSTVGWQGELHSYRLIEASNGDLSTSLNWNASDQLPAHGQRQIFTRKYDAVNDQNVAIAFEPSSIDDMTLEQQDYLGAVRNVAGAITNQADIESLINFLRGDTTNAGTDIDDTTTPMRFRPSLLGDIVHARPVYMKNQPYGFPGSAYETFKNQQNNRQAMLYFGANDGIFHAINADTGAEVFGFVADTLFPKLKQFSEHSYNKNSNHRYFYDGVPTALDAKLQNNWQTVITVPFGAGGKGLFTLNITDPTATTPIDDRLVWEINDKTPLDATNNPLYPDMGYILNQAKITRINDNGNEKWVAITGNGVDSSNNKAVIYIINMDDGSLRQAIDLGNQEGATSVSAIDLNADTYTDRIYASTLNGKVWRLDLDENTGEFVTRYGSELAPKPLFIALDDNGNNQPITGGVTVSPSPLPATAYPGVIISFGTGKFYEDTDVDSTDTQSFYTVWEKDFADENDYAGELERGDLITHTITNNAADTARTITGNLVDYANGELGWYTDLPDEGERIISKPVTFFNRIVFHTTNHSAEECSDDVTNNSWLMQVDRLNGGVVIPNNGYFDGEANNVSGVKTPFSSQSPQFIEHGNGSISYPNVDKDGNVDDTSQSNLDYFRSSTRQLQ